MLHENSQDFNVLRKAFHECQARGQKLENTFSQVKLASFTETTVTTCSLLPLCSYNTVQNYHVQRKWPQRGGKGLFTAVLQPSFYFYALFKYSGCFKGLVKLAFVDWTQKTNSRKMQHFPPQPEHSKSTVVKQRQSKLITKYTAAPTWQKAKGKKILWVIKCSS